MVRPIVAEARRVEHEMPSSLADARCDCPNILDRVIAPGHKVRPADSFVDQLGAALRRGDPGQQFLRVAKIGVRKNVV